MGWWWWWQTGMRVGVLEVMAPCFKRNGHNPDGCGDVLQSLTTVLLLGACSLELPALLLSNSVQCGVCISLWKYS